MIQEDKKLPLGTIILATINLLFLGAFQIMVGLSTAYASSKEEFLSLLREQFPNLPIESKLIFYVGVVHAFLGILFFLSGLFILLKKKFSLKFILTLSIFWVFLGIVASLQRPVGILGLILFILYPGICIFYFTRRDIKQIFE